MNIKKLIFLGLIIVNYSLAADLNKFNQETFGLYDAAMQGDVQKVKDILGLKGNDISRENYVVLLATVARATIEEMGAAQRAQGPTRTEMRTGQRAQARTRERGELEVLETQEMRDKREKFNKQREVDQLIRDKMLERGFLERRTAARPI